MQAASCRQRNGAFMAHVLKRYTILGILFVTAAGTLWHYVYDWTGRQPFIGFFFPVNESTWEHMKLVFFPMVLYALFMDKRLGRDGFCLSCALLAGILLGTLLIPVLFYTYTGIIGTNFIVADILVFILSVLCAFFAVYRLARTCRLKSCSVFLYIAVCIFFFCFLFFTYNPPGLALFENPEGIKQ